MEIDLEEQEDMPMVMEPDCLFSKAAAEWLARLAPELKTSSEVRYRNILNSHLLPEFGDRRICEISRSEAESFRQKLLQERFSFSPGTANGILSMLKRILTFACLESGTSPPDLNGLSVRQSQYPLRVFTLEEQQELTRYLLAQGSLPAAGILLSLCTGLRIGEICALKWEDISLEDRYIQVRKTMQRVQVFPEKPPDEASSPRTRIIVTSPKSACSQRIIPLPAFLTESLRPLAAEPFCYFLTGRNDRFMEPRSLENHFSRVVSSCGIDGVTFHTLRHTFATRAIELGFDPKSLSEILGHASVNITMNRYVHPSMEFKRENMDRLSGLFPTLNTLLRTSPACATRDFQRNIRKS